MNIESHDTSERFLYKLNHSILCLRAQEGTLENDMKNLDMLHELYYDIRYARITNKASIEPSVLLERKLKTIYKHLAQTINKLYQRQRQRLIRLHTQILEEELKNPKSETFRKQELQTLSSRIVPFCNGISLLLP